MAYLDDLSDEERAQQNELGDEMGGDAPTGGSGGGGASSPASSAPAPSSGFANLSSYFNANQEAATTQGSAAVEDLTNRAEAAIDVEDAGEAMDVLGDINASVTPGGLASTSEQGAGYTSGMAGLDGYLSTRGGGDFSGLQDLYGDRLAAVRSDYHAPVAPVAPEYLDFLDWQDQAGAGGNDGETAGAVIGSGVAGLGATGGNAFGGIAGAMAGGLQSYNDDNPFDAYGQYRQSVYEQYQRDLAQYQADLAAYNEYLARIGKEPEA